MNADKFQFVALKYDTLEEGKAALKVLKKQKKEGNVTYQDAVVGYKNKRGKAKLVQTKERRGFLGGGTAGLVLGMIFGGPLVAAAVGAMAGGFAYKGMDNKALKHAVDELVEDESILFIMVKDADYVALAGALPEATSVVYREVIPVEVVMALDKVQENYETAKALDETITSEHTEEDDDE